MYARYNEERMDELLSKIKYIQENLNRLVKPGRSWCSDPEVLSLSQKLDAYINEYHRLAKRMS